MCRVQAVDYAPSADHVPEVRHWVEALLLRWELKSLRPEASLLVTELATNAVVHAQSAFHVVATVADGILEVGVSDHDPRPPLLTDRALMQPGPDPLAVATAELDLPLVVGGRGMALVDAIADDWGVVSIADGKQVWFRLSVDSGWSYRTACPCAGKDLDRVRLESGRFAVPVAGEWDAP